MAPEIPQVGQGHPWNCIPSGQLLSAFRRCQVPRFPDLVSLPLFTMILWQHSPNCSPQATIARKCCLGVLSYRVYLYYILNTPGKQIWVITIDKTGKLKKIKINQEQMCLVKVYSMNGYIKCRSFTVTNESTTLGAEPTMSRSSKVQISSKDLMIRLESMSSCTENTAYNPTHL